MHISFSVKFFSRIEGTIPESSFHNPHNYTYYVDVFGNPYFMLSNSKENFDDFNRLKLMVFEFIQLNANIIEKIDTQEKRAQIFISFYCECFDKFSYMITVKEMGLLSKFSVALEVAHINVDMD